MSRDTRMEVGHYHGNDDRIYRWIKRSPTAQEAYAELQVYKEDKGFFPLMGPKLADAERSQAALRDLCDHENRKIIEFVVERGYLCPTRYRVVVGDICTALQCYDSIEGRWEPEDNIDRAILVAALKQPKRL